MNPQLLDLCAEARPRVFACARKDVALLLSCLTGLR